MAKAKKVRTTGRPQASQLTPSGREIPDPQPYSPAIKSRRAASIRDHVVDVVRSEQFRRMMEDAGEETFEEADDFDIDDDFDPSSPYEEFFEGEYSQLRQARIEQAAEERRKKRRGRQPAQEKPQSDKAPPVATPEAGPPQGVGAGVGVATLVRPHFTKRTHRTAPNLLRPCLGKLGHPKQPHIT